MRRVSCILLSSFLLLVIASSLAGAEIVVIVNMENPVSQLSREEVIDIFMGREMTFPDGEIALPFDQATDAEVRREYYQELVGKTVAQINAYWARLLFTGRATPPRMLPSTETILDAIEKNRNAISYIEKKSLTEAVKVVYELEGFR